MGSARKRKHDGGRMETSVRLLKTASSLWPGAPALAVSLMACATPASSPPALVQTSAPQPRTTTDMECVHVRMLAEWQPVDDHTLLLLAPGETRGHLLRITPEIPGLQAANEVDIVDGDLDDLICPHGEDAIVVEECDCGTAVISSIEYLSEQRTAELLDRQIRVVFRETIRT